MGCMDTQKHINIPMDDALLIKVKVWCVQHGVNMSVAGRAMFEALATGNPDVVDLVIHRDVETSEGKPKRKAAK